MLFSQLDPEDIAEMTDLEPVADPNETEEEKQKKLVIEAGSYTNFQLIITTTHISESHNINLHGQNWTLN